MTAADINYYQVIYQGKKVSFLEKVFAEIKGVSTTEYNAYKYQGDFEQQTKNYVLRDGQIEEIYRNKKKILSFLDSKELEKFVKEEKLNFKKNEDLIKAFEFYELQTK
jgi:hypothetical protein